MATQPQRNIFTEEEWSFLVEELALSPRQAEITELLFEGMTDKQIANQLNLALPTIRTHFARLYSKLQVQDRVELILHVFSEFRQKYSGKQ